MLSQMRFLNVLERVLSSKIALIINALLIANCIWNVSAGDISLLLVKLLIIILIVYNLCNVLIAYICSKFYVKADNNILEYNTFGFKGKINLRKAEYTIIPEEVKILKHRLSGISINGLDFGKYSIKNNYGNTFVYSTKEKGIGIIVSDENTRLFVCTDKTEEIVAILTQIGGKTSDLQVKKELSQAFQKSMIKHIVASNVLLISPMVVLFSIQNILPEQIPVHWNSLGEITTYWTKEQFVFHIPLTILCFNMLFCLYCAKQRMNRAYVFYVIVLIYYLSLGIMLCMLWNVTSL
jgi:hypothetical protein